MLHCHCQNDFCIERGSAESMVHLLPTVTYIYLLRVHLFYCNHIYIYEHCGFFGGNCQK